MNNEIVYVYIASTPHYLAQSIVKIGCAKRLDREFILAPEGQDMRFYKIWQTSAKLYIEMKAYKEIIHNRFHYSMRNISNEYDWFEFRGRDPLIEIAAFLENKKLCPWIEKPISQNEIQLIQCGPAQQSRFLQRPVRKNVIIKNDSRSRLSAVIESQQPIIARVRNYIIKAQASTSSFVSASQTMTASLARVGHISVPYNYGKAHIVRNAIAGSPPKGSSPTPIGIPITRRVVICTSDSYSIQYWRNAMSGKSVFSPHEIMSVGTDTDKITDRDLFDIIHCIQYCIIIPYDHVHRLINIIMRGFQIMMSYDSKTEFIGIPNKIFDLVVLDDAHNLTNGNAMLTLATRQGVPCIAITSSPNFLCDTAFGQLIANVSLRDLINRGLLPDYHIWALHDRARKGQGNIGRAKCIVEAWRATAVCSNYMDAECAIMMTHTNPILRNLIVFVQNPAEVDQLNEFFRIQYEMRNTNIFTIKQDQDPDITKAIKEFNQSQRAIMITCCKLGENVNIHANAVAIMHEVVQVAQLAQLIFCAGAWTAGFPVFHILFPIIDDLSSSNRFVNMLSSIAFCDTQLFDEIRMRARLIDPTTFGSVDYNNNPSLIKNNDKVGFDHIVAENFNNDDIEQLRKCFNEARANVTARLLRGDLIREMCIERGIKTSAKYRAMREDIFAKWPELPANPRNPGQLWYDYFHPNPSKRIHVKDFIREVVLPNRLKGIHDYAKWYANQKTEIRRKYPRYEYIIDGYFGEYYSDYNNIAK